MGAHSAVPFFINFCPLFFSLLPGTFGEKTEFGWKTMPKDLTATAGHQAYLVCSFTSLADGDPEPRWRHLNDEISKGDIVFFPRFDLPGNISTGNYGLLIKNVTRNDEGPWICSHILARPQTRTAYLTVKVPPADPEWGSFPEDVNATMGEEVHLSCWLTGLDEDDPKPRWEHIRKGEIRNVSEGDQVYLPNVQVFGNFSIGEYNLLIQSVTSEDEGSWRLAKTKLTHDHKVVS